MEISFTSTMCTKGRIVLLYGLIKVNALLGHISRYVREVIAWLYLIVLEPH